MFVVKDGTIGIGPVAPSPLIAWSSRGDTAIAGSALQIIDPDSEDRFSALLDAVDQDDQSDAEDEELTRSNRFQLNPSRVNDILAEAERSRSGSPAGSIYGGVRPSKIRQAGREITVRMSDDVRDGANLGWDGWRRVLQADMGCVMRRRAEEGYGMGNVGFWGSLSERAHTQLLLNAAIATRYPGHERLAGIWEFIDRELTCRTVWSNPRFGSRHGSRHFSDEIDRPHICRYTLNMDRKRYKSPSSLTRVVGAVAINAGHGTRSPAVTNRNRARTCQTGFGRLDVPSKQSASDTVPLHPSERQFSLTHQHRSTQGTAVVRR